MGTMLAGFQQKLHWRERQLVDWTSDTTMTNSEKERLTMMNEIDALASLVGAFAVCVCRSASELTPKRKAQMLFLLTATSASVAPLVAEKEDEERKNRELIDSAVETAHTEFWNKSRKKRSTTGEEQEMTTTNKKRRPCKHDHDRASLNKTILVRSPSSLTNSLKRCVDSPRGRSTNQWMSVAGTDLTALVETQRMQQAREAFVLNARSLAS